MWLYIQSLSLFRVTISRRNTWTESSVFRTHFWCDVGKESHLLASRDTETLDVKHRGADSERTVVVVVVVDNSGRRSSSNSSRGRGSHSEGHWKAKRVRGGQPREGLLGDFWTAVLNQVSFPRQWVSGTSNLLSLSHSSILLDIYREQCGWVTRYSFVFPAFFSFFLSIFFSSPFDRSPLSGWQRKRTVSESCRSEESKRNHSP